MTIAYHHQSCFCRYCRGETQRATPCECTKCAEQAEGSTMALPAPKGDSHRRGPLPTPDSAGQTPFLKADDIKKKGETILLLTGEVRELKNSQYGAQVAVAVELGGESYTWPVKIASPNYRKLFERFGADDAKWKGKVKVQRLVNLGKEYIAVV